MNSVSKINQRYITTQITQKAERPLEQKLAEMEISKKAVVCSITVAAGIIALASTLIYKSK